MMPTAERNHQGILIQHKKESVLFDCGEGIQRQLKKADVSINRISKIFLSHWHGDHVLGLPGLFQTMAAQDYSTTLKLYGPKGTKQNLEHLFKAFVFQNKIDMEIIEIEEGVISETEDYIVEARELDHTILCYGFSFLEKSKRRVNTSFIKEKKIPEGPLLGQLQRGENIKFNGETINVDNATYSTEEKKIAIIVDTLPCEGALTLATNADILICEATHHSTIEDKAYDVKHMTSKNAGLLASNAGVGQLIITHFSQRYKTTQDLEQEARDIFPNTVAAFDLMKVKIK